MSAVQKQSRTEIQTSSQCEHLFSDNAVTMANHTYIGRSLGRAMRAPLFNHEIVFVDDCCIFHVIYHLESSIPMYSISCLLFPSQAHTNTKGKLYCQNSF